MSSKNSLNDCITFPVKMIENLRAENEQLKAVIAWANNSLFGSHNFFLSINGGPPDEHHLDTAIEDLKDRLRKQYQEIERLKAKITELGWQADNDRQRLEEADRNPWP